MAINYAGGVNRNDVYTGVVTKFAALANINTTLSAAGWTSAALLPYTVLSSFNSNPSNNETVTLDGKVYTFKTAINNANNGEILIDSTADLSLSNLKAAVNLGAGSGTKYSSATTLNTNLAGGVLTTTALVVEQKSAVGGPYTCSETLAVGSFNQATTINSGFKFTSATTAQYQACKVFFYNIQESNTTIRFSVSNVAETEINYNLDGGPRLFGAASQDIRVIANRYQCFIMIDGTAGNVTKAFMGAGVPWLPNFITGSVITAASNATPIVCTTSSAHGYTTGDAVTIRNVLGNTAANVTANNIIVLSATTFSLNGSVGNGVYTSGGVCGRIGSQVAEAIWTVGSENANPMIRSLLNASGQVHWTALNGSLINQGTGTGCLSLIIPYNFVDSVDANLTWYNTSYLVTEPFLAWGTSAGGIGTIIGQLWDCVFIRKFLDRDVTGTFDTHNWWNLTDSANGGSNFRGCFLHVVP